MRLMALDYGTARVGVAVSDELAMMALPLEAIRAKPLDSFFLRLKEIIAEKEIGLIVVGMPRNMDGSYGFATEKAREFIEMIKSKLAMPVEAWDERLTTAAAHRMFADAGIKAKNRKDKIDSVAAQNILQSYLDAQAFKKL
ncbi:MAG: Holliday junction resolvase RuvX [Verrucomicrobiota bacterium]|nr:Holliday junction resolvase RuvX [Verrucomicrobiota bacterium]